MKRSNPARTYAQRITLCLVFSLVLLCPAAAAGMETESVEAEGSAAIHNNNLAQAREQAISLALRGALEKVLSSAVSPQILAAGKSVITDKVYPVTERYILSYRIVREAEQDGAYAVRIAATVDAGSLKGDLRSLGVLGGQGEERTGPGYLDHSDRSGNPRQPSRFPGFSGNAGRHAAHPRRCDPVFVAGPFRDGSRVG